MVPGRSGSLLRGAPDRRSRVHFALHSPFFFGVTKMKYMLLIYMADDAMNDAEREACYKESTQLTHDLHANGQYIGANPLYPTSTATSVRVREGKSMVT